MMVRVERDVKSFEDIMHEQGTKRWVEYMADKLVIKDPNGCEWYRSMVSDKWVQGYHVATMHAKTTEELAVYCYDAI